MFKSEPMAGAIKGSYNSSAIEKMTRNEKAVTIDSWRVEKLITPDVGKLAMPSLGHP